MSKFTTEVRYICESEAGYAVSQPYEKVEEVLEKSYQKIFSNEIPFFDENYRVVLEKGILRHFYTREIGVESVGLWKLRLNTKLREIMPYYNKMYKSETLDYNPLYNFEIDRTHNVTGSNLNELSYNGESNETVNGSATTTNKNTDQFADTPQNGLTDVATGKYLSSARVVDDNATSTNTGTNRATNEYTQNGKINTTEEYIENVKGKQGDMSYSKMIMEYREALINIDVLIYDELEELFMQIWE